VSVDVALLRRGWENKFTLLKPAKDGSIARIAFWMVSSNVLPIAMTSPTDFIDDESAVETRVNFLRSHRGILTTR
jgi:hypothetical protein